MTGRWFDPTISWGTILSIFTFLLTAFVLYTKIVARLTNMEMKLNLMWSTWRRDHQIRRTDDESFFDKPS